MRTGVRIGVDQHADKRNHAEPSSGWVTLAIRGEGIARNGMVYQMLSPAAAHRLIAELTEATAAAEAMRHPE